MQKIWQIVQAANADALAQMKSSVVSLADPFVNFIALTQHYFG